MNEDRLQSLATSGDVPSQIALARILRAEGQLDSAEMWLRRAAETGNVEAIADLGLQLFLSPPPTPDAVLQEGVKRILDAANAGHMSSAHMAALIAASESSIPDNWHYAIDYAALAASRGYRLAQISLAFLANDQDILARLQNREFVRADFWQQIRERIDVAPILEASYVLSSISGSPYVAFAEGFIPPSICDWIIERAKPAMKKGKGYVSEPGRPVLRTNSEVEYGFHEMDLIQMAVRHRIAHLVGFSQTSLEPSCVFHYAPGEQFTAHHDFFNPDIPQLAAEIARAGQCVVTVLIYLNDDFDGGETEFLDLDIRVRGRKGDALIFRNVDERGQPDMRTRHAGKPPTRGEKWLFSQFVRNSNQANKIPG